jgi:hypothetical protein
MYVASDRALARAAAAAPRVMIANAALVDDSDRELAGT